MGPWAHSCDARALEGTGCRLLATVSAVRQPGPLLASGRASDIFECGPGLVLRRSRRGRSMATEAREMDYARAHGYPVTDAQEIGDGGPSPVTARPLRPRP